jgi:hypothetical protein
MRALLTFGESHVTKLASGIVILALASTAIWAAPAFAQMGKSNPGSGEETRSAPGGADIKLGDAKPIAPPKIEADEASRAPILDEGKAVESFTVLTRSADGKVSRSSPSEEMRGLVIEDMKKEAGKGSMKLEKSGDPSFANEEEAGRQVFGRTTASRFRTPRSFRSRHSAISRRNRKPVPEAARARLSARARY